VHKLSRKRARRCSSRRQCGGPDRGRSGRCGGANPNVRVHRRGTELHRAGRRVLVAFDAIAVMAATRAEPGCRRPGRRSGPAPSRLRRVRCSRSTSEGQAPTVCPTVRQAAAGSTVAASRRPRTSLFGEGLDAFPGAVAAAPRHPPRRYRAQQSPAVVAGGWRWRWCVGHCGAGGAGGGVSVQPG